MDNMKNSIWTACLNQIMDDGDQVNININMMGNVEFKFERRNKNFGIHTISYPEFEKLLKSNLDTEMLLSDLMGMAYNNLMDKEGNPSKLMV